MHLFFLTATAPTETYTLSLHDALPISWSERHPSGTVSLPRPGRSRAAARAGASPRARSRSEEHTSELQSRENLVCRLLLEKKKKKKPDRHLGSERRQHRDSRVTTSTER